MSASHISWFHLAITFSRGATLFLVLFPFAQAQTSRASSAASYVERGNAWYAKGELDKAIADYDFAIAFDPQFADAYYNRAVALHGKGDLDRALDDLDRAIQISPRHGKAHVNRGAIRYFKGDFDGAINDNTRAIKLNPRLPEAYSNRGLARRDKGDLDRAIADFSLSIKLNPNVAETYNNRGTAWYLKRGLDRAISDHTTAIKLDPGFAEAYNARALAWQAKGDLDVAIADYNRAIEINPRLPFIYANRGVARLLQGKDDEAQKDFDQCLDLDSSIRPMLEERIKEAKARRAAETAPPSSPKGSASEVEETTFRVKTEVVTLDVTVTDRNGHPIIGLSRERFEIYEDGVRQSVEYFSDEDAPLSIGIVFDLSASMRERMASALRALRTLIQTSHRDDEYFLIGFNDRVRVWADFGDGDALLRRLGSPQPGGNTALYDAVYLAIEKVIQGRRRKRALVIISDGQDNASRYGLGEVNRRLKESDVQVYGIGLFGKGGCVGKFCQQAGEQALREVTRVTGGEAFPVSSSPELEDAVSRIALELRRQYSLGYVPTDLRRDGRWRKIKVRVQPDDASSRFVVRTREGYYAIP